MPKGTEKRIAPSILSADFARLGNQVQAALDAGVKIIHIDVMDGHFVPNISIGPLIVEAIRPLVVNTDIMLDVHLMIENPDRYLEAFAKAGADNITIHAEAAVHLHRSVQAIHELGCTAGVALNPASPVWMLEEILPDLDLVLIMTVNPGFGGQAYIPGSTDKIQRMRFMLDEINSDAHLEVDGGIKTHNIAEAAEAGANIFVAGSAIFSGDASQIAANIQALQEAINL